MAKTDRPWWGNNDPLSGGETFKGAETKSLLGVRSGDLFRVEKTGRGSSLALIPHKDNVGTWKQTHNKNNPVKLTPVKDPQDENPNIERAFSMTVTTKPGEQQELFLVEFKTGKVSIKKALRGGGGQDDGTCSVER